jgi:glycosyltransferase involved in cell wall biosynthesis
LTPQQQLPGVSVIMPTLNSERYFDECLGALFAQDYPRELLEVILIDAGSTDRTLEIAERYGVDRVLPNPLKTGEAGKAVGLRAATQELVLTIDSDNVLIGDDWLRRMVAPLMEDPTVVSSECLRWEYRREDHFINRYQALTGINDPMALFVGNYDRWCELHQNWTQYPHLSEPRNGWERVTLDPQWVPTMGANGYLVRRDVMLSADIGDYLFDIDVVHDLVQAGHTTIARVDVPIRHYFVDSIGRFTKKTRRRAEDYFHFRAQGARSYPWTTRQRVGVLKFALSTVLVIPLLLQVVQGYRRKPDPAWLFHIPACWITFVIYVKNTLAGMVRRPEILDREGWSQ